MSATELAGALDLPHGFLRKIMKALSREGIVASSTGKGGGFELIADPEKLSVYDVIRAIQRPVHGTECSVNRHVCPNTGHCPVRRVMLDVFRMNDENEAEVIADPVPEGAEGSCREAAENCPVDAITTEE